MLNPQVLDTQHPEFTSKGLGMRCSEWLMQRVRMLDEGGNVEPFDFYFSVPDCVDPKYRTMGSRHARVDEDVAVLPAVWRPVTTGGVV